LGKHQKHQMPRISRDPLAAAIPALVIVSSGVLVYRFPFWWVMCLWAIALIGWAWWAIIRVR
jgi:hypothetical protein